MEKYWSYDFGAIEQTPGRLRVLMGLTPGQKMVRRSRQKREARIREAQRSVALQQARWPGSTPPDYTDAGVNAREREWGF